MKIIKVFAVCLIVALSLFCFSKSQAQSNNTTIIQQNETVTASNYTLYEIINNVLCIVTYSDDGKIVDITVVE